ncbi:Rv1355c family protein [Actinomycetospora straminea]|uniref:Rv1355c family protein n=1 Tax=Actinomycetospora straminea TaxID=663607 RepID=A0ABP9EJG3_9PSEU|nr:Rv1355c family protein [Actinomycetospora straminea]MDD7933105.1 Rv1355c family protein [Actinomycetospora straminea]
MSTTGPTDEDGWRAVLLDEAVPADAEVLAGLRADPGVTVIDRREAQHADLAGIRSGARGPSSTWAFYPWRRTVVAVLGEEDFRRLRLDRNRNKITAAEQDRLRRLRIGVVGLSVGHTIAHTLALEGLCGELRLADFDAVEVSNLNRLPATLLDLGLNKAVVAARRIAELDPYLTTVVEPDGVTDDGLAAFLDGLDVLVEECDSLDVKVRLREEARRRRIPVLMETSDRGLLDVERFDLEPDRPLLHGLLGDVDSAGLRALSAEDKVPHVLRILGAADLSARTAASMVEVGRTLTTWPQLGGDVTLGGATVAAAVRRLGTGRALASGRVRVDLDERLDALGPVPIEQSPVERPPVDEPAPVPPATAGRGPAVVDAVLEAIRRAPSGGNVQPWRVEVGAGVGGAGDPVVHLRLDRERTTTMDVEHRGSYVALGAALFNARTAAAAAGALGPCRLFGDPADPDLVATLRLGTDGDERLAAAHAGVLRRGTNRAHGRPAPLADEAVAALREAAHAEGGRVHLVTGDDLVAVGETLAASDRVRYLTERLHREMFAELVEPGAARTDVGIETRTLGLDPADLAKLAIARRPEVMALLADWDAGVALGEDTRDRLASSSALAVVTVAGSAPADFVRGGAAVEAVWVAAEDRSLAVHPTSPVFLYATCPGDLVTLSPRYADRLAALQSAFRDVVGLAAGETVALVLRLSHADVPAPRSRRRPLTEISSIT